MRTDSIFVLKLLGLNVQSLQNR